MSEWIKLSDKKPDDFQEVMFCCDDGSRRIGYFVQCHDYVRLQMNGTSKAWDFWHSKPTHWQELPPLPEGY